MILGLAGVNGRTCSLVLMGLTWDQVWFVVKPSPATSAWPLQKDQGWFLGPIRSQ